MAKKKSFVLKAKHKSKKGGLTAEGRRAYNRATGSNLKRPQPEGGSRKKSYCARSKGQMKDHNIDCSKTPDKRICLARRRWKCNKSLQKSDMPPKAKLAAFLRDHIDNKLALKAAEPTITKSDEKTGMSALMKALKECACKKSDKLPGGKGDTKDISDFDAKEVEMGLKVEMEHTKDREVAQEIVADHLSEDPSYYSKLKGSGLADELKKVIVDELYRIAPTPEKHKKIIQSGLDKITSKSNIHTLVTKNNEHIHYITDSNKPNGNVIGYIVVKNDPKDEDVPLQPYISSSWTEPSYRQKGIRSLLQEHAKNHHEVIYSDTRMSPAENNIWKKFNAELGTTFDKTNPESHYSDEADTEQHRLKKAGRCWEGYEPTPGKKPYSKGSCRKIQKSISAEAIEAGQYQGEKLDSHHHNRLGNEYKGMAQKAHKMGDRKKAREFHDKALHHFKMADKLGFQEEEPLEKKISGKVAAGLTALAGMVSSPTATTANKPPQIEAPKPIIPQEKYPDLGSTENITSLFQLNTGKPLHMFLWNIAQLESTGGENTDHAIITDPESPHYGTKAIGNFALMPNTVKEFVNRYRLNGGKDPRILKIAKMNARSGEINKYIEQNPDIEFKVAGNAAKHVIEKHGYSPEAAYAWKYGHNKTPESIKSPEQQAKMKADKYVSDFKQLMEGGSPKKLTPAIKISKPDVK